MPANKQTIFVMETLSAKPTSPIPVVTIKIVGPTRARRELIYRAFSKSLNFNMNMAAVISMLPDIIRNAMIKNSAFSITTIILPNTIDKLSYVEACLIYV